MIAPLSNHLIVQRVKRPNIGAILMPQSFLDDNNTGGPKEVLVLAVGPGRVNRKGIRIPIECEPGDHAIIYSHTSGPEPLTDGNLVITDDQILAVLPKQNTP